MKERYSWFDEIQGHHLYQVPEAEDLPQRPTGQGIPVPTVEEIGQKLYDMLAVTADLTSTMRCRLK